MALVRSVEAGTYRSEYGSNEWSESEVTVKVGEIGSMEVMGKDGLGGTRTRMVMEGMVVGMKGGEVTKVGATIVGLAAGVVGATDEVSSEAGTLEEVGTTIIDTYNSSNSNSKQQCNNRSPLPQAYHLQPSNLHSNLLPFKACCRRGPTKLNHLSFSL